MTGLQSDCPYCGPNCHGGACHNARAEDGATWGSLPGDTAQQTDEQWVKERYRNARCVGRLRAGLKMRFEVVGIGMKTHGAALNAQKAWESARKRIVKLQPNLAQAPTAQQQPEAGAESETVLASVEPLTRKCDFCGHSVLDHAFAKGECARCICTVFIEPSLHSTEPAAPTVDAHTLQALRDLAHDWNESASAHHLLAVQNYPANRESYADIYRECRRELLAILDGAGKEGTL